MTSRRSRQQHRRVLCLAPTVAGGKCRNYADTCPHPSHRGRRGEGRPAPPPLDEVMFNPSSRRAPVNFAVVMKRSQGPPLVAADPSKFRDLVDRSVSRLGLSRQQVVKDYWLVRSLYELCRIIEPAGGMVGRTRFSNNPSPVGGLVFSGGTSLSAAWNISPRFSEDIDLMFSPNRDAKPNAKQTAKAMQRLAEHWARLLDARHVVTDRSPEHFFFTLEPSDGPSVDIDIALSDVELHPVMCLQQPITSLVAREADDQTRRDFPEAGGMVAGLPGGQPISNFRMCVLGPGSTAMNKLLAHTHLSLAGDLESIRRRARDIYDLAMIARHARNFEGHIGRDSARLLSVSQQWRRRSDAAVRPKDGFASLGTFNAGSPQHSALRAGYEAVLREMVWGESIPLDEAIRLALSLDPGPSVDGSDPRPHRDGVAWPTAGWR